MWTQYDRDKAMAYRLRQRETCPGCGTRRSEWTNAVGGPKQGYVAEVVHCRGCEERQRVEASIRDRRGQTVVLRRKT